MRADRLLSILLMLQTRGKMTALEISEELEVSVRTVYRDVDALSLAGVPIYTERGPDGGIALLEPYRTNLTHLTENEIRALFLLNTPVALHELGIHTDLKSALLKLAASLPTSEHSLPFSSPPNIILDPEPWYSSSSPIPALQELYRALLAEKTVHLTIRLPFNTDQQLKAGPLGLVAKAARWYLVFQSGDRIQVKPVDTIRDVLVLEESHPVPVDFDLGRFWRGFTTRYEQARPQFESVACVSAQILPVLPSLVRSFLRIEAKNKEHSPDWVVVRMFFDDFGQARRVFLGLGQAAEVIEPIALRRSILDFAEQILQRYQPFPSQGR